MVHFDDIAFRSKDLLELSVNDLVFVLSDDELNVKSEETVFECILRWINHDEELRAEHMPTLLRAVRLGLLSKKYFKERVKASPVVSFDEDTLVFNLGIK